MNLYAKFLIGVLFLIIGNANGQITSEWLAKNLAKQFEQHSSSSFTANNIFTQNYLPSSPNSNTPDLFSGTYAITIPLVKANTRSLNIPI